MLISQIEDKAWSFGDLPEWAKHYGQGALENTHILEGCFPWEKIQVTSSMQSSTIFKEDWNTSMVTNSGLVINDSFGQLTNTKESN